MDTIQLTPDKEVKKSVDNRQSNGRFGPGNIANPHGRPRRDWTWKELLEEVAEEFANLKDKEGNITARAQYKKLVAKRLYTLASGGNVFAIKELMNRMDGMPQQDITSNGEKIETGPTVIIKSNEQ